MWPVFSCKWQWSRKKGGTHVPEQDFLAITPPYRLTATLCATDRLTATVGEKASAGVVPHSKERRGGTARICEKNSGRGQDLKAIALRQRGHGLRSGLRQRRLGVAHRRRDPGHPLERGLGELLQVLSAIEGTIGDEIGGAVGGVQLGNVLPDNVAELLASLLLPLSGVIRSGMPA